MGFNTGHRSEVRKAVCGKSRMHGLEQGKGVSPTYCYKECRKQKGMDARQAQLVHIHHKLAKGVSRKGGGSAQGRLCMAVAPQAR